MQGLEATDDIITHQPLIEYIGNVMLRDQYDNGETSLERYVLYNVVIATGTFQCSMALAMAYFCSFCDSGRDVSL